MLLQNEAAHAKDVDFRRHEGLVRLFGRTDDGVPAKIEAGVDDDRTAGAFVETLEQLAKPPVTNVHRLNSRGEVDVRHGGDLRAKRLELVEPRQRTRAVGQP